MIPANESASGNLFTSRLSRVSRLSILNPPSIPSHFLNLQASWFVHDILGINKSKHVSFAQIHRTACAYTPDLRHEQKMKTILESKLSPQELAEVLALYKQGTNERIRAAMNPSSHQCCNGIRLDSVDRSSPNPNQSNLSLSMLLVRNESRMSTIVSAASVTFNWNAKRHVKSQQKSRSVLIAMNRWDCRLVKARYLLIHYVPLLIVLQKWHSV